MALTILSRPEKTLENGYVSKWNASATPLIYKFSSDRFPTNNLDAETSITSLSYAVQSRGTQMVVTTANKYDAGDWVTITGSPVDGTYNVKEKINSTTVILDLIISDDYDDTTYPDMASNNYYRGYKALVKVYCGAPEYHPYDADGSKPQTYIGTIEVQFDKDNIGDCNVRNFIKPDMAAKFSDLENNPNLWTSFAIEYAEVWDALPEEGAVYEEDILENCSAFTGFVDPDFNNGVTDWDFVSQGVGFVSGTGEIIASGNIGNLVTDWVGQDLVLRNGIEYGLELDFSLVGQQEQGFTVSVFDEVGNALLQRFNLPTGVNNITANVTPIRDTAQVYLQLVRGSSSTTFQFAVTRFQLSSNVADPCKYSSFSILGAKQFQDALGGNFGDYIASFQTVGKLLTHFEELRYPFYINSLIPSATFNRSEQVNLNITLYDEEGNVVEDISQEIEDKSDGVYVVDPAITSTPCAWKTGVAQITSVPTNLLLDGDNGTYEVGDSFTWNITSPSWSAQTPDQIGSGIGFTNLPNGSRAGTFNFGSPNMSSPNNPFTVGIFDTPIQVVQGETYIIETEVFAQAGQFEPSHWGVSTCYLGLEGYDVSEFESYSTFLCPDDPSIVEPTEGKLVTVVVAKGTTLNVKLMQETPININISTGGTWILDNTKVRGPIEYLTEVKPLNSSCGGSSACQDSYELQMRWLNDLGGWDRWNFTQNKTFGTTITKKIDIRRDVTLDWDNNFSNGDSEYDALKIESRDTIVVRSQNLTKDEAKTVSKIRTSIKPQAFINGNWVTVTISGNSFVVLEEDSKVREISFSMSLQNTLIQEQ